MAPAPAAPVTAIPASRLGRLIGKLGEVLIKYQYPRVPGATTTTTLVQPSAAPVYVAPVAPAAPAVPPVAPTLPPLPAAPTLPSSQH